MTNARTWSLVALLSLAGACSSTGSLAPDGGDSAGDGRGTPDGSGDGNGGGGGLPQGWLYTSGNGIYKSDGAGGGAPWTGRGVNIDDTNFCGGAWKVSDPAASLLAMVTDLMTSWKPTFVRVSLSMYSYAPTTDWSGAYRTAMTNAIRAIGAYPGTYVLVTMRTHANQVLHCDGTGANDATCMPNSLTAMDSVYRALVDDFKDDKFVLFAITNEPGGADSPAMRTEIRTVMEHAVQVIRAEEDAQGTPHHLVAVQGTQWTSILGWWNAAPLTTDGVVYEYHSYPPEASGTYGYTQPNLPVIIGEYGPGSGTANWPAFYADIEAKHIPNLAWDYSPLSDCTPDLLTVGSVTTPVTTTSWGATVKQYLLAHAP